jgi:hypothetical protein
MNANLSPYDPGPRQRCGKPSEVVLKVSQQVVNGEDKHLPDRRLCLGLLRDREERALGSGSRASRTSQGRRRMRARFRTTDKSTVDCRRWFRPPHHPLPSEFIPFQASELCGYEQRH